MRSGRRPPGLAVGLGPLLHRMAHEQRTSEGFSPLTATGVWVAWAAWTGLLVDAAATTRSRPRPPRAVVLGGAGAAAAGLALFAAGAGAFPSGAQLTGTESTELVTSGPYRFSRHPQYLGAVLVGAGTAAATGSGRAGVLTNALVVVLHGWSAVEEEVLDRRFGRAWQEYRARTPRWLGLPGGSSSPRERRRP